MATGAPGWMIAVPCRRAEALHDAACSELRFRDLTPRHRRDLGSLAAIAFASTLSAIVIEAGLIPPAQMIESVPLAMQVVALAPQAPNSIVTARDVTGGARRIRRPASDHRLSTDRPAQVRLASNAVAEHVVPARSFTAVTQLATVDLPAGPTVRKAPGAVKRVLFGSGQYRVQPFPTPTVSEQ